MNIQEQTQNDDIPSDMSKEWLCKQLYNPLTNYREDIAALRSVIENIPSSSNEHTLIEKEIHARAMADCFKEKYQLNKDADEIKDRYITEAIRNEVSLWVTQPTPEIFETIDALLSLVSEMNPSTIEGKKEILEKAKFIENIITMAAVSGSIFKTEKTKQYFLGIIDIMNQAATKTSDEVVNKQQTKQERAIDLLKQQMALENSDYVSDLTAFDLAKNVIPADDPSEETMTKINHIKDLCTLMLSKYPDKTDDINLIRAKYENLAYTFDNRWDFYEQYYCIICDEIKDILHRNPEQPDYDNFIERTLGLIKTNIEEVRTKISYKTVLQTFELISNFIVMYSQKVITIDQLKDEFKKILTNQFIRKWHFLSKILTRDLLSKEMVRIAVNNFALGVLYGADDDSVTKEKMIDVCELAIEDLNLRRSEDFINPKFGTDLKSMLETYIIAYRKEGTRKMMLKGIQEMGLLESNISHFMVMNFHPNEDLSIMSESEQEKTIGMYLGDMEGLAAMMRYSAGYDPDAMALVTPEITQRKFVLFPRLLLEDETSTRNENKQLRLIHPLPYSVLYRKNVVSPGEDTILVYSRDKSSEKELKSRTSIGYGGHINDDDVLMLEGYFKQKKHLVHWDINRPGNIQQLEIVILFNIIRELEEETGIIFTPEQLMTKTKNVMMKIYDESNEVGRRHFGLVNLINIGDQEVGPDAESPPVEHISITDIIASNPDDPAWQARVGNLESWSLIIIDAIRKGGIEGWIQKKYI